MIHFIGKGTRSKKNISEKMRDATAPGIGVIYCLYLTSSRKWYIGQSVEFWDRIWCHSKNKKSKCRKLFNAVLKYGWEDVCVCIIDTYIPHDMLDWLETFYINEWGTVEHGYNILKGGSGGSRGSDHPLYGISSSRRIFDNEELREILLTNGGNMKDAAKILNVGVCAVSERIKRWPEIIDDIKMPLKHNAKTDIDEVIFLINKYQSKTLAADHLGMDLGSICAIFRRHPEAKCRIRIEKKFTRRLWFNPKKKYYNAYFGKTVKVFSVSAFGDFACLYAHNYAFWGF